MLLNLSATKDAVLNLYVLLKCALKFECYQTCGLTHVTKCALVCSLFCGLDFVCALSFLRSSNKKCGLNPALPKTCGLKKCQYLSHSNRCKLHLLHNTYSLAWQPAIAVCAHPLLWLSLHTPAKLPQISPFSKISSFRVARANPLFLLAQKYPFFNPQNSTYIRATDLQTRFLRSTDSVHSSDTVSFAMSPIGRVIEVVPNMWSLNVVLIFACGLANKIC